MGGLHGQGRAAESAPWIKQTCFGHRLPLSGDVGLRNRTLGRSAPWEHLQEQPWVGGSTEGAGRARMLQNGCPELLRQILPWLPVLAGAGAGQRDRQLDQTGLVGREQRLPASRSSAARASLSSTGELWGSSCQRSWPSRQEQTCGVEAGAISWQARIKMSCDPHPHFILPALKSTATGAKRQH